MRGCNCGRSDGEMLGCKLEILDSSANGCILGLVDGIVDGHKVDNDESCIVGCELGCTAFG